MEGRRRSSASLIFNGRPSSSLPSKVSMALAASSVLEYSTKAKPRGRPVARSLGMYTSTISPASESRRVRSAWVVWKFRLPTKFFAGILFSSGLLRQSQREHPSLMGLSAENKPSVR